MAVRNEPTPAAAAPLPLKGAPPAARQSRLRGACWLRPSVAPRSGCAAPPQGGNASGPAKPAPRRLLVEAVRGGNFGWGELT